MAQGIDPAKVTETLSHIRSVIVVLSGKGGVGKSTVAVNVAAGMAARGRRVGLLDADLHGPSVPGLLGVKGQNAHGDDSALEPVLACNGRVKVMSVGFLLRGQDDSVIWRGPLKHAVISQFLGNTVWGDLDLLVVDSPPGTGDEPLSVVQIAKPAGAVVVTTPQEVATSDVRRSIDFCRRLNLPVIGVIENMSGFVCPHCGRATPIFGFGGGRQMAESMEVPFLGALPIDPAMVALGDAGRTCFDDGVECGLRTAYEGVLDAIVLATGGDSGAGRAAR